MCFLRDALRLQRAIRIQTIVPLGELEIQVYLIKTSDSLEPIHNIQEKQ